MDFDIKDCKTGKEIEELTNQFMSLIDSNDIIESSFKKSKLEDSNLSNSSSTIENSQNSVNFDSICRFDLAKQEFSTIDFSNIGINCNNDFIEMPEHAIKFDSVEKIKLNNQLESLYREKQKDTQKATMSIIDTLDSSMGKINAGNDFIKENYSKIQTDSTLKNKEVCAMYNYSEEQKGQGDVFSSFATIPEDRALVEKRNIKELLLMDIPWETEINIWEGFKAMFNTNVEFTF